MHYRNQYFLFFPSSQILEKREAIFFFISNVYLTLFMGKLLYLGSKKSDSFEILIHFRCWQIMVHEPNLVCHLFL